MDLGEVAAVGVQFLPDVGHGVQPDDVHALVAQEEHVLRHVVEDHGIAVVQVPLVGVEGGHHHLARLLVPGEVARGGGGEDLRHGTLEADGDLPVVIEEIALLTGPVAGLGPAGPFMVLAGVVHHEVQAQGDAPVMTVAGQGGQILHGAQLRLDLSKVRHGVAPVAAALGAFQQGHQVQIADAAFLHVIQLFPHAPQSPAKGLDVHLHAHQVVALVPGGVRLPPEVQLPQGGGTVLPGAVQHVGKIVVGLPVVGVELEKQLLHLRLVAGEALGKDGLPVCLFHCLSSCKFML